MTTIKVGIADKASREFHPIIVDFPIADSVLYSVYKRDSIEDIDGPILYAVRQLMGIPEDSECVYGIYAEEIRDPDGNIVPDPNPNYTKGDFVWDLWLRWVKVRRKSTEDEKEIVRKRVHENLKGIYAVLNENIVELIVGADIRCFGMAFCFDYETNDILVRLIDRQGNSVSKQYRIGELASNMNIELHIETISAV